jgi:ABC-type proline/glycine betaine transport system permease subunit
MKRFKKLKISIIRLLIIAAFLVIWEVAANVGLVDSFIFSSPTRIVACFQKSLANGAIFRHSAVTLGETFLSFAIIILAGVGIALLLWLSPFFTEVFEPFLVILNSIPKSALAPMLIVWLGNSPKAIIVTAVSVAIFGTIINVYTGFNETDEDFQKHAPSNADKAHSACVHRHYYQQYESCHRAVSGRRDYRRIFSREVGAWLLNRVQQPNFRHGYYCNGNHHPVYPVNRAVQDS